MRLDIKVLTLFSDTYTNLDIMKLSEEIGSKSVITTRYVLDANSTITYVSYDEAGDWLFFGDEDITDSDTCAISIEQILELDDTLDLLDLSPGQGAKRIDIDSDWHTMKD